MTWNERDKCNNKNGMHGIHGKNCIDWRVEFKNAWRCETRRDEDENETK